MQAPMDGQVYMGQAVPVTGQPYDPNQGPPGYYAHPHTQQVPYGGHMTVIQMPYNPGAQLTEDQVARMDELAHLYHSSRSIKCFTIIDCFLVTLYALSYWPIILLLPFPMI